jgi:farnesol kinase/phytol kinase
MAAGDGLADLLGRRLGANNKWPFNKDKSIAGSLAFWAGGTACSLFLLKWMPVPIAAATATSGVAPGLILTGIIGATALLELLPGVDDNWVVPLSAAVLTMLFLS